MTRSTSGGGVEEGTALREEHCTLGERRCCRKHASTARQTARSSSRGRSAANTPASLLFARPHFVRL